MSPLAPFAAAHALGGSCAVPRSASLLDPQPRAAAAESSVSSASSAASESVMVRLVPSTATLFAGVDEVEIEDGDTDEETILHYQQEAEKHVQRAAATLCAWARQPVSFDRLAWLVKHAE
jgi:hypothetical protein